MQLKNKALSVLVTFSAEPSKDDHEQSDRLQMRVQGQNPGQFSNLEDSEIDIRLIKLLFCSVAKVKPLVLMKRII